MEEEPKKSKNIIPIITMVICALLVIALGSYAYWQVTKKQRNINIIESACLDISYSNESDDISLLNAWPLTDNEGADLDPYSFTITNNCNSTISYTIALESIAIDGKSESDYLGYGYLKLKLDNNSAVIYGGLNSITSDSPSDYTVRDTKKITELTLGSHESVTHNLRLWIDENTPLEIDATHTNSSKYFYGKVKVVAVQRVETSTATSSATSSSGSYNLTILSKSGNPTATINNIEIGDRVGYSSEEFYVIGKSGNNVELLSRYLINVGNYSNPNYSSGLQNRHLGQTRTNVDGENTVQVATSTASGTSTYSYNEWNSTTVNYEHPSGGSLYGTVPFAGRDYWTDYWLATSSYYASASYTYYNDNAFVYNNQASISQYVTNYADTLRSMGLNVIDGTLLSVEEVFSKCNQSPFSNNYYLYSSSCPSYIFETSYWLGSVAGSATQPYIYIISAYGFLSPGMSYSNYGGYGVRPVINIVLY